MWQLRPLLVLVMSQASAQPGGTMKSAEECAFGRAHWSIEKVQHWSIQPAEQVNWVAKMLRET